MRILAILMSLMLAVLPGVAGAYAGETAQNGAADYLRLNNDTEPGMLTASYWLDRCEDADALLLTETQIAEINALNSKQISVDDVEPFSLTDVGDTISGETVRSFILHKEMPEDPAALFLNGEPTSVEYWEKLFENRAVDAIEDTVSVRFGYSVCRTPLRRYTTDDFIGENADDTYYNEASRAELLPFLPVAVIHESADGEWCYVITYGFGGWTRKESIAICPSREDWIARQAYSSYLTVTGRELRLAVYPDAPSLSGLLLPMGTRLPLVSVEDAPDAVHGRQTYGCYVAKLPMRLPDGSIGDELYPIPVSEDVCFGSLPCTRANIIRQIFKFVGDRYGWAGDHYSTDCSGLVHEVFACFGLQLARTAGTQARTVGLDTLSIEGMTSDEKMEILGRTPIGSLVYFSGHIMFFLGVKDGKGFVLSAIGSFVLPGMAEGEVQTVNCVCVNALDMLRRNGTTWLENLKTIVNLGTI